MTTDLYIELKTRKMLESFGGHALLLFKSQVSFLLVDITLNGVERYNVRKASAVELGIGALAPLYSNKRSILVCKIAINMWR